jgi:hypothetical protein
MRPSVLFTDIFRDFPIDKAGTETGVTTKLRVVAAFTVLHLEGIGVWSVGVERRHDVLV